MISRRSILLISTVLLAGTSSSVLAAAANPIKAFDLDADGTLDLNEVKKAATELFNRLDPDHDIADASDAYLPGCSDEPRTWAE